MAIFKELRAKIDDYYENHVPDDPLAERDGNGYPICTPRDSTDWLLDLKSQFLVQKALPTVLVNSRHSGGIGRKIFEADSQTQWIVGGHLVGVTWKDTGDIKLKNSQVYNRRLYKIHI